MLVEYSGRFNIEKVRRCPPAEMSSPQHAGFPSAIVPAAGFSVQWVHMLFHRAFPSCQEKCLEANKHQTCACKCWLLKRCQLHWLLWQVTTILPICPLYYVHLSFFCTVIIGCSCNTRVANVLWYNSQATSLKAFVKRQQTLGVSWKFT